ncbi:hypothetical protein NDU88_001026 [Pleurodeles waltl]|uniref:Uncharacterized protein n=1 Tax=Pleurodeles waltl TaxID=8319 RepID=A0AAV7WJN4_PLEWA|nr:hypothetical protein NDU88_001026 [Pleurodeles waltl]
MTGEETRNPHARNEKRVKSDTVQLVLGHEKVKFKLKLNSELNPNSTTRVGSERSRNTHARNEERVKSTLCNSRWERKKYARASFADLCCTCA